MSVPTGSAVSNLIDEGADEELAAITQRRQRGGYLRELMLRRQAAAIRRQAAYGLVFGWVLTLVGGFVFFCVPSPVDWLWCALMLLGLTHLILAVAAPQALAWPERGWMALARWQGWLVMTVLLTIIYFTLIWPASYATRRRTRGFISWDEEPPALPTAWQKLDVVATDAFASHQRYRSLPVLLAGVIGFFFRRGDYILLPILVLLLVLGLLLYFVQSSALAPFIYTLF